MRVARNASLGLAAAALLVLAGCGKDNEPSEFDAAGMTDDVTAIADVWNTEGTDALVHASAGMSGVLAPADAGIQAAMRLPMLRAGTPDAAARQEAEATVRSLAQLLDAASRPGGAAVVLPSELLGTVWTYDVGTASYIESAQTVSNDRVRVILYAMDGGAPAVPLAPVGHLDLIERSTATAESIQLQSIVDGVTWLDYRITARPTASGGEINLLGYVRGNGERLNFDLRNTVQASASSLSLHSDFELELVERRSTLDYTLSIVTASSSSTITLNYQISGPNGDLSIVGTSTWDGETEEATFNVKVNGRTFATITYQSGVGYVVHAADGATLTEDEIAAIEYNFDAWAFGLEMMDFLTWVFGAPAVA